MNLVNAKAAIMRQYERRDMSLQAQEEVDRIKTLVTRLSAHKLRVSIQCYSTLIHLYTPQAAVIMLRYR